MVLLVFSSLDSITLTTQTSLLSSITTNGMWHQTSLLDSTMEWNTPWTMMLQVNKLNWDHTGKLVLASKGDSNGASINTIWCSYISSLTQEIARHLSCAFNGEARHLTRHRLEEHLLQARHGVPPYTQMLCPTRSITTSLWRTTAAARAAQSACGSTGSPKASPGTT